MLRFLPEPASRWREGKGYTLPDHHLLLCHVEKALIYTAVQIKPRKHVLCADNADYTAYTRQPELDHALQECICPERSRS